MSSELIKIKDKTFRKTISEQEILLAVSNVAKRIEKDYSEANPVFVVVLNGAFVFASDLLRLLNFPCTYSFTKLSSYEGINSNGRIAEQLSVTEDITGRHVVIIEDIVDTGFSMQYLVKRLQERRPASIEICALSHKPEKIQVDGLNIKYTGMTLPEAFIVGYGLDYDGEGRQLRDIYSLLED
ncbi:MAG: hypoxanthine phosphoribosyltransferase [Prevotella sp.]|nr:hypoxanthine phosphoribosyltransferase [Prevotella sp.]MBR6192173.1 hypoxanthine phosphoribosyltransferase [Prevotella sp.]